MAGQRARQVRDANTLVDYTVSVLQAQLECKPGLTILEHPEDLGKTETHCPGSIWQFPGVIGLLRAEGTMTGALRQCDFGMPYHKPTRLLCRLPGLEAFVAKGLPEHDAEGRYSGPLPPADGKPERLIGTNGDEFKTAATASWPERLCDSLAALVASAVVSSGSAMALAMGDEPEQNRARDSAQDSHHGVVPDFTPQDSTPQHSPPKHPQRRKIRDFEFKQLAGGGQLQENEIYIGRGGRGVQRSKWCNPSGSERMVPEKRS